MMNILVIGSWHTHKAMTCKTEAEQIGKALAERGHILVSGGGTGISELVVNSYRAHKGKKYIAYFPSKEEMAKVGEEKGPKPDEEIDTKSDYPTRNVIIVKNCDAMIALHGGLGTISEIVHAVKDYGKKVVVIDKGDLAKWVKSISELHEKVLLTADINKAMEYLES